HHVYVRYAHDSISLSRLSHSSGTARKVTTGLMHRLLVSHTSRQGKGPEPLLDEPTNLLVVSEHQRTPVALPRLVGAAEAAEHVGPSQMKGGVPLQGAGARDALEQVETLVWADRERDGNRPIQLDDGRAFVTEELAVQASNLGPVRTRRGRGLGVHGSYRGLDLIGAGPPHEEGSLEEPKALLDLRPFPPGPILIFEQNQ